MIQGEESVRSKTDPEHCNDDSDNLPAKESSTASEDERASNSEQPDQVKSIGKEETANSSLNPELERHGGDSPPKTTPAVDDTVALRSEIADLYKRTTELSLLVARSEIADAFLASSSHQLTHHGLERLHAHVAEGALSVFFRNNHFGTLTKREGNLYLLVSDLGYANTPEIVWERLDGIDGDTEYADEFFKRPAPRKELAPASGPTVSPELLLAQRGQAEADYRMALAMSEGATVAVPPPRTDDDEARLMEAARELSLRAYHGVEEEEDVITTTPAATDADAEVAAAYERAQRREERDLEQDSERLARQLQELEYARQRRPMANARAAAATTPARAATSNCTVS